MKSGRSEGAFSEQPAQRVGASNGDPEGGTDRGFRAGYCAGCEWGDGRATVQH